MSFIALLTLLQMRLAAHALSHPQCTVAGLTNNCEIFEKYGKKTDIPLSDGESFKNPLVQRGKPGADPEDGDDDQPVNAARVDPTVPLREKDMRLQSKTTELWGKLPSELRVSSEFKADFNALQPLPDQISEWAGRRLIYPPGMKPPNTDKISIVWPPTEPGAKRKTIPIQSLVDFMKKIPTPYKQQMKALLQARTDLKVEALNAEDNPNGGSLNTEAPSDLQNLFNYAKNTLLDEIAKGRDPASLKSGDLSAYDRIKTISFGGIDTQSPSCAEMASPAEYKVENHSFVFCPGGTAAPKIMLLRMMAHEMAHSIGPCQSESPLVKVNWQAVDSMVLATELPKAVKKDPELLKLLTFLAKTSRRGPYSIVTAVSSLNDQKAVERAQKLGLFEVVAAPMSEADNPSTPALTCLRDTDKIRDITEKDLDTLATRFADRYQDATGKKIDRPSFLTDTKNRLRPFIRCLNTGANHMQEAIPDAWSAKVVGKYATEHPVKNEMDRLALMAFDLPQVCGPHVIKATGKASDASIEEMSGLIGKDAVDPHPASRQRTEKLLLAEPRIQKALGCEPASTSSCLTKLGTNGEYTNKSVPTKTTKKSRVNE